jgi:hypothetical protein
LSAKTVLESVELFDRNIKLLFDKQELEVSNNFIKALRSYFYIKVSVNGNFLSFEKL